MDRVSVGVSSWVLLVIAVLAATTGSANANPEPSLYDARSVGLAGTGVSWLDNPAGIYVNPAALQSVDDHAVTVALAGILADLSAPISGPDDVQHTGYTLFPSGMLGGALRLTDRLVVGAGGYAQTGFGASYEGVDRINETDLFFPEDQSVLLFVVEAAAAASVKLHDRLHAGLSLRFPYARLGASLTQEISADDYRLIDQTVSGFRALPGVLAGFQAQLSDRLRVGAAYRSKVTIDMDGTTGVHFTQAGPTEVDTTTDWTVPHMIRFGGAVDVVPDRLMVTSELRIQLHRKANRSQIFETELAGFETIEAPYDWKNVYSFMLAGEYVTTAGRPVRLGFSGSNSATPRKSVQFFTPPPGPLLGLFAGSGMTGDGYAIDLAVSMQWGHDDVPEQPGRCQPGDRVKVGCAGEYGVTSFFLTASYQYGR